MPRNQQIPGERFHVHDRVRALLLEVKTSPRGLQIILSRAHRNFLRRLLENEVPEIYHGMVEIRSIAREPGQRSKVAVAALQAGVDPVGACVGIRGVRIQAIVRELNDEKIDVIEWNADPAAFIAKALSPARVSGVYLNDTAKGAKTATVVVPEDQLSLAIGRDGQNARLAAKLTSWRIDIKSLPEAASDALYKLQHEAVYAFLLAGEEANLPALEAVLAKKAEGRPVTPEEYQILSQFVERVERGLLKQRQSDKKAEEERLLLAKADVPAPAFEMPLADFPLSDRVFNVISEAGYQSVGDLMLQMRLDSDEILKLAGMGPKGMAELEEAIAQLSFEDEAVVEETVTEVEPEAVAEMEAAPAEVETEPEAEVTIAESEAPVAALEEAAEAEAALAAIPESVIPEVETTEEDAPLTPAEAEAEMEALFALRAEELAAATGDEEEEEDDDDKKKKKKKKKKYVEVEYDPEADVVIAKKKRKRGGEWDEQF
jgi:N utilization substance protein A